MPLTPALSAVTTSGTYTNWHGTVSSSVNLWMTPQTVRQLRDALSYCFEKNARITMNGSGWSLSSLLKPDEVLLDLGMFNPGVALMRRVPDAERVKNPAPKNEYFHVLGNALVKTLNHRLALQGWAFQTTGASNGQVVAGAIATGAHGAAVRFGAMHDAVRALCIITGPDTAALVQPADAPFNVTTRDALAAELGMPVTILNDDDAFGTALVALGACGVVYSAVVEVEPLYQFWGEWVDRDAGDATILDAIRNNKPESLTTIASPWNVSLAFNPYAKAGSVGIWSSFLEKLPPAELYIGPHIAHPRFGNAFNFWVAQQSAFLRSLFPRIVDWAIKQHYHDTDPPPAKAIFPGDAFGDTTLVEGMGRGIEVAVHREDAGTMLDALLKVIREEGTKHNRFLPGAMGMRYVGRSTHALLGMNSAEAGNTTTKGVAFFEVGALANANDPGVTAIFSAIRNAARNAGVPFTLHWGLESDGLTPQDVQNYFGAKVQRWKNGRSAILPSAAARSVFRNPLTDKVGLTL